MLLFTRPLTTLLISSLLSLGLSPALAAPGQVHSRNVALASSESDKKSEKSELSGNSSKEDFGEMALKVLSEYLKIDTTVPPGNETRGAKYLKSVLEKEGIKAELFETAPGRSMTRCLP